MYKLYDENSLKTDELFLELLIDEDTVDFLLYVELLLRVYDRDVEDIIRPYREDIMSENGEWGAICE